MQVWFCILIIRKQLKWLLLGLPYWKFGKREGFVSQHHSGHWAASFPTARWRHLALHNPFCLVWYSQDPSTYHKCQYFIFSCGWVAFHGMYLIDTGKSMVVTKGKGEWRVSKEWKGQIYGERRRFHSGWWAHYATDRWYIIELYTWDLCNLINHYYPQ